MFASSPDIARIMARTSPPILHQFIDELSFWDGPSQSSTSRKAKERRSQNRRWNIQSMRQTTTTGEGDENDDGVGSCNSSFTGDNKDGGGSTVSPSQSSLSLSSSASVWKTAIDKSTGKPYYYDSVTRRTQWEKPDELRQLERRRRAERRRRDRKFFDEMEANLMKALERGEIIPGVPFHETPDEGPPQEPLLNRKPRVRTISGMDDVLLAELRDDSSATRNHHHHRQLHGGLAPKSILSSHTVSAGTNPTTRKPPLPRPTSSKNHVVAFQDDMILSPDMLNDATGKHPFQKQQQEEQQQRQQRVFSPTPTDQELAGESLLDAPIHNEWSDCMGTGICSAGSTAAAETSLSPTTCQHTRRNTGGTIYLQNTMTNPDIQATMRCVCAIIRAHIIQDHTKSSSKSQSVPREYLVFKDDYGSHTPRLKKTAPIPSLDEVTRFYEEFYKRSQMEHDTIITSLIYLERLIKETNGALAPDPENWHSILFATMVLASKVWDDLSMWNVDFSNVSAHTDGLSSFTLGRINQLEIELLKILHFDVKVPASEYAKYYFLIRTMLLRSGLVKEEEEPLQKRAAFEKFESVTRSYETNNNVQCKPKSIERRVRSMDATFSTALAMQNFGLGPVLRDTVCLEQLTTS
jgi:WW domain/Cyclin